MLPLDGFIDRVPCAVMMRNNGQTLGSVYADREINASENRGCEVAVPVLGQDPNRARLRHHIDVRSLKSLPQVACNAILDSAVHAIDHGGKRQRAIPPSRPGIDAYQGLLRANIQTTA